MALTRRSWAAGLCVSGLVGLLLGVLAPGVLADVVVLRGGGRVRGKVITDPAQGGRVLVILERGKTPLSLQKAQVQEVIAEASPLDGYVVRRAAAKETASSQYDLGLYCEQNKLSDLARVHYEAANKIDTSFGPAHEKLGHTLVGGHWLKGDELREAQGLVKYKGRWITREEMSEREKENATAAEVTSWTRRIRVWLEAIVNGSTDRRREAESQLLALTDTTAVKPLVKTLGKENDEIRSLLARVLGHIPGEASSVALATQLVNEEVGDVRTKFLEELDSRKDPAATKTLVRALKSSSLAVLNRAAWALGRLNALTTVPELIPALVSTRQRMVMVGGGDSTPGGFTASFGSMPYMASYGTPAAFNGSTVGYLTPPAMAPGAIAFGATSAPYYGVPSTPVVGGVAGRAGSVAPMAGGVMGGSFGIGGGTLGGSRGPVPQIVNDTYENTEVHAALVRLTSQDFGYDRSAWRNWLTTSYKSETKPARRVPQP